MDFPGRIIKQGETDARIVKALKQQLNKALALRGAGEGFQPLDPANPNFGPSTKQAVRLFRTVSYYVMGTALDETAGYSRGPSTVAPVPPEVMEREYPHVVSAGQYFGADSFDATFELGWELMLTGIAALVKAHEGRRDGRS